jgi:hypothetical protein
VATTDQLVSRLRRRLTRLTTNIDATILDELAAAQTWLEDRPTLPFFLLTSFTPTLTGETLNLLTMSPNYIRLADDDPVRVQDTSLVYPWVKLSKDDTLEVLYSRELGTTTSYPLYYAQHGFDLYFRAIPATPQTIRVRCYQRVSTVPVAGNSTLWTTHAGDLLMSVAGREVAKYLRDNESAKYYDEMFSREWTALLKRNEAQAMAGLDLTLGGD